MKFIFAPFLTSSTLSRMKWAIDDLRALTRWFRAQPMESLDDSKRGALGILAGDLLGAIERGLPKRTPVATLGDQRLFFGGSQAPIWLALEPVAPRTQEWVNLLSGASGVVPSEVVRTLVLDPAFAPTLPIHALDHGKSFSRLGHFTQWCAEASDRLWERSESRHQGNVARDMVAFAKRSSSLFASLARVVQKDSNTGERMRAVFGELWMRGELRLATLAGPDASLPSCKAMLAALGAPQTSRTTPRRKAGSKESHAHRRLGLWRARRSGIEALGVNDAALMNGQR